MSESRTLRVGVIGAGANTRAKHIPGLQEIAGVSIEVVCNRSRESSQTAADQFGIPRIAEKWEDVVEDPNLDAICIGTWPYLHAPISIAALENGKHVLTEARMAMNATEGASMLEVAEKKSDLTAQIVPAPFTLEWDKTIAGLIAEGALGELREIHFSKALPMNIDSSSPISWRQDRSLSGNNVLMLGIYYEPILRWFDERPRRVLAQGSIFTEVRNRVGTSEKASIEIPESLSFASEYESGLILTGRMTGVELGLGRDEYVINGSKGTLRLDVEARRLTLTQTGKPETEISVDPDLKEVWQVESDFVASIREGRPVRLTNFKDGLDYMKFTDAVIGSIETDSAWKTI